MRVADNCVRERRVLVGKKKEERKREIGRGRKERGERRRKKEKGEGVREKSRLYSGLEFLKYNSVLNF